MTQLHAAEIGWEHPDDPGEPSTGVRRLSISDNEAKILSALAFQMVACELGTGLGVSTRAIARTAESVVTVDIDPWVADAIAPDLITTHQNLAFATDRDLISADRLFDFVFIDGDHTTAQTAHDIVWAYEHVYPDGSLIVLHDANYASVRRALPDDALILDTEHGLAVLFVADES